MMYETYRILILYKPTRSRSRQEGDISLGPTNNATTCNNIGSMCSQLCCLYPNLAPLLESRRHGKQWTEGIYLDCFFKIQDVSQIKQVSKKKSTNLFVSHQSASIGAFSLLGLNSCCISMISVKNVLPFSVVQYCLLSL